MNENFVTERIKELCALKGWSYYKLAKESGIPHSTLHNTLHRCTVPTFASVEKICDAFGISLSQFFDMSGEGEYYTEEEKALVEIYRALTAAGKSRLVAYAEGLTDREEDLKKK